MRPSPRAIDVLLACTAGFTLALVITGGWQLSVFGRQVSAHGLYTPMLLLTVLALMRVAWPYRHAALSIDRAGIVRFARAASVAMIVAVVILSPVLYAVGVRIREGGLDSSRIRWRTSPPGVDLVSFVLPNPNHYPTDCETHGRFESNFVSHAIELKDVTPLLAAPQLRSDYFGTSVSFIRESNALTDNVCGFLRRARTSPARRAP